MIDYTVASAMGPRLTWGVGILKGGGRTALVNENGAVFIMTGTGRRKVGHSKGYASLILSLWQTLGCRLCGCGELQKTRAARRFGEREVGYTWSCGTYEVGRPDLTPYSEKVGSDTETENFELMKGGEGNGEFIE